MEGDNRQGIFIIFLVAGRKQKSLDSARLVC